MFNIRDNKAIRYVRHIHGNQMRDDGVTPYIHHLLRVSDMAWMLSEDVDVWIAALLHDSVEDQFIPLSFIAEQFGNNIAKWVRYLTNEPIPTRERTHEAASRRDRDDDRITSGPMEVLFIKACDRFDNMSDMASFDAKRTSSYIKKTVKFLDKLDKAILDNREGKLLLSLETTILSDHIRKICKEKTILPG